MSRFEDEIVRHKRAERKQRQEFLFQKIGGYKMASFTMSEAYTLMRFFDRADPSDEELMEATNIIERHIADIEEWWKEFRGRFSRDDPPV